MVDLLIDLATNTWTVFLDTAFWLLIGLLAAGLIRSFISETTMQRWVGGSGIGAVTRAALFGAPLPLCSCGVLPAALGLRRSGASKEATVSFLISTPETSVDSVAVTYALMGPVMAVYRPLAALVSAVMTGLLTAVVDRVAQDTTVSVAVAGATTAQSCCGVAAVESGARCSGSAEEIATEQDGCCEAEAPTRASSGRLANAVRYAATELLDDISGWMVVGIVIAGIMITVVPPGWLAQWGQGIGAMLIMVLVGIPMYICAVASTPVAAALLLAGVSPGAVLVFLLVGPATNIASFALVSRELGMRVTVAYFTGISVISIIAGLLLEQLLKSTGWRIEAQLGTAHTLLPAWLMTGTALLLLVLAVRPVRRVLLPWL